MSDRDQVACEEDHEVMYVLKKYEKRQTKENLGKLRDHCRAFKKDDGYKPHNRENFYKYIEEKKVLAGLE